MGGNAFMLTLLILLFPILLHKGWKAWTEVWTRICRIEQRLLLVTGSEVGAQTQSRVFEEAVYEGILKLVRINDNKLGQDAPNTTPAARRTPTTYSRCIREV